MAASQEHGIMGGVEAKQAELITSSFEGSILLGLGDTVGGEKKETAEACESEEEGK
jgi:hypothetical protein